MGLTELRFSILISSCYFLSAQTLDIRSIAGPGPSGDGGTAAAATFRNPVSIAVDEKLNIYVADRRDHRIRRFQANGVIETIAGTGVAGNTQPGQKATETRLNEPNSVVLDPQGRIVFSDAGNCRILRREADGTLKALAGLGGCGAGGDGTALTGRLGAVGSLAIDTAGVIYFTDTYTYRVRRIGLDGIVSTIAGTGERGTSGDLGPATVAQLLAPRFIAVDKAGTIYFSDGYYTVRAISNGTIRTLAGTGRCCASGDNGSATQAKLDEITGLYVDSDSNVYISSDYEIRRVTASGFIYAYWGTGDTGFSGDGGAPADARFKSPAGVTQDAAGNFYIADSGNLRIRKVTNNIITTIAGGRGAIGDTGPATDATIISVSAIATGPDGSIYFADALTNRVRRILPTGTIVTVAGNGQGGFPTGVAPATQEPL